MATPAKSHTIATPKANPSSTPTRMISQSPRAPANAMNRSLSHKSPAVKTPASLTGHSHHVSMSSQPTSTPIGAPVESALYSSPATNLIVSLGLQGLTPQANAQLGLGITTGSQVGSANAQTRASRNTEAERIHRLREIQLLLRPKVAGRGVTREGVERLGRLAGLDTSWDSDLPLLSIVGNNFLDLEIVFDTHARNVVKDVNLKYGDSAFFDSSEEAGQILKDILGLAPKEATDEPWNGLEAFATNLEHLSKLEQLSVGVNCFEAVGELYKTFRSIWEKEKERRNWKSDCHHICRGTAGRPIMNKRRKLGVALDYWVDKQELYLQKNDKEDTENSLKMDLWTARIDCELGEPPLRVSQNWVSSDVFPNSASNDNGGNSAPEELQCEWLDPDPTFIKESADAMQLDGIPQSPNCCFVCNLDPPVLLPLNVIAELQLQGLKPAIDPDRAITYQQALQDIGQRATVPVDLGNHSGLPTSRWTRESISYASNGEPSIAATHSYALYSSPPLWCYSVSTMSFSHPRQIAETLPILRQYVRLWSILSKLVSSRPGTVATLTTRNTAPPADSLVKPPARSKAPKANRAKTRSNQDARRKLLNSFVTQQQHPPKSTNGNDAVAQETTKAIDISLNLRSTLPTGNSAATSALQPSASKPTLDIIFPVATAPPGPTTNFRPVAAAIPLAHVALEIGPNGSIVVAAVEGLPSAHAAAKAGADADADGRESDATAADAAQKQTLTQKQRTQCARVLSIAEDIGVLVDWICASRPQSL